MKKIFALLMVFASLAIASIGCDDKVTSKSGSTSSSSASASGSASKP